MDLKELSKALDRYLRTETFPLGILSVSGESEIPDSAKIPSRDMRTKLAVCQAISMARKYGWTVAAGRDDVSCPIAKAVFGFEEPIEYYTEGNLAAGMYAEGLPEGKKMEEDTESKEERQ